MAKGNFEPVVRLLLRVPIRRGRKAPNGPAGKEPGLPLQVFAQEVPPDAALPVVVEGIWAFPAP